MPHDERSSSPPADTARSGPRHPQQEVADLLAAALLRLRARYASAAPASEAVDLGFLPDQRGNANPSTPAGACP